MKKLLFVALGFVLASSSIAQLQAPVLNSPLDSAVKVDVNKRLTWSPSLGGLVTGYEAQISLDASFTSPINLPVWGASAKTNELDFNQRYFWRARAKGSGTTVSPWSDIRTFVTFYDEFKNLVVIDDGVTGYIPTPDLTLRWDSVAGVDDYVLYLDVDSLFTSPVSLVSNRDINSPFGKAFLTNLFFGQTYYWKIKARHSKDESGWSERQTFTVLSQIKLKSPADSIVDIFPKQTLQCENVKGVTEYRFMVDDSTDFDSNSKYFSLLSALDKDFKSTETIKVQTQRLGFGSVFYWRVQGVNNSGPSSWSEVRRMYTVKNVQLTKPTNNKKNVPTENVEFGWKKIGGVESYELQYDFDTLFSSPTKFTTLGDSSTNLTLNLSQWDLPYYWRVRAVHAKDTSDWSSTYKFSAKPTGVEENINDVTIQLYPNPANDVVYIDFASDKSGMLNLELYNIVGEKVDQSKFIITTGKERLKYDIGQFNGGVYMVVLDFNGQRITRRLTIK